MSESTNHIRCNENDRKIIEDLKQSTGIRSFAEIVRFALREAHRNLFGAKGKKV